LREKSVNGRSSHALIPAGKCEAENNPITLFGLEVFRILRRLRNLPEKLTHSTLNVSTEFIFNHLFIRRDARRRGGYMRQFSAASTLAALLALFSLAFLMACGGGGGVKTPTAASLTITPAVLSLNEGQVLGLTTTALNSSGGAITVDITYSSSNPALASVSSAGLVCGGQFDTNSVVCSPNGDGQATITATSGTVTATATIYVHKQVDRVVMTPVSGCASTGTVLNTSASAYNTSAQGCSVASPCDITSTVGPFTYSSANLLVAATAAGINPNYSSTTNSPTYNAGGTITGSSGQTCNLSDFSVGGGTGIDPTYNPSTNSPTYTSGGSITGAAGQTCTLSNFNGVSGAVAQVLLTGTNTIATGARLTVTNPGTGGGSVAPTTADLSPGTATCSGTVNVSTALLTTVGINPVVGATATVSLTGTNAIAAGTHLTITNQGFGAVSPPTTARLSNGTATCTGTASVTTSLNSATGLEAQTPGSTALFANVAGVNSVGVPFTTCPVQSILIHDANGSGTTFLIGGGQSQPVIADVMDSNGQTIKPTLTWVSSQPGVATVTASTTGNGQATITGVAPGTTVVTATCSNPDCNINLPPVYSNNVINTIIGGSSSTTVFAASSKSLSLVPISTTTNTTGTAITLPNLPNSIVAAAGKVFLGSGNGVMVYDTSANTITTLSVNGTVLAASSDANFLLIADPGTNLTYFYSPVSNATVFSAIGTALSGVITPDNKWSLSAVGQQLLREGVSAAPLFTPLSYTPNNVGIFPEGSLTYVSSSGSHSIDVRSTCDQSDVQTLASNNPSFVEGVPNGTGAVAVDSPRIDVITTPAPTGSCPVSANSSINNYDLGAGSFNPRQLLVSFNSSKAWVVSDLNSILSFDLTSLSPTSIPLFNGAQGLSGGMTLDSAQLYVGGSDGLVHRIDTSALTDAQQIDPGLKDSNSNSVPPELVAVLPK
jgi:hypothetical protein